MVCQLIEPEAWTLPSPRKICHATPPGTECEQPVLCQSQTQELLREDRFSSPKRNFRTSTGRRWQREVLALRAELEATKEMVSCRFSGERTDFAKLRNKISSLEMSRVAPCPRPRWEASRSPSPKNSGSLSAVEEWAISHQLTARMYEPDCSSPPKRHRSPIPSTDLSSRTSFPQGHLSLGCNSALDVQRFCGLCGVWYKIANGLHQCSQNDMSDLLTDDSIPHINNEDVEKQVEERMVHFERVQRMRSCGALPCAENKSGVHPLRMKSCELPIESAKDHGSDCIKMPQLMGMPHDPDRKDPQPESGINAALGIAFNTQGQSNDVPYDHTRARGAELRGFGSEIDALTADLMALEGEIQVACPV